MQGGHMKNYNPTISGLPEMSYLSFNNPGLQPWAVKICFFRDIMASKRPDQISMPQGKINIHDFLPLSLALKGRDILAQAEGLGLGFGYGYGYGYGFGFGFGFGFGQGRLNYQNTMSIQPAKVEKDQKPLPPLFDNTFQFFLLILS